VASDPEPEQSFRDFSRKRTIVKTYSHGAASTDLLEVQRSVGGIRLEQILTRISQLPNLPGQSDKDL
jgi:hypothetical protein